MSARTWDLGLGLSFAALGALLVVAGWRLPPGVSGVPGPGVFPMAIGVGLMALGIALASMRSAREVTYWDRGWSAQTTRQVVAVLALLTAYIVLWDVVPFMWRTPLLLLAVYRIVGEPWLRSLAIAAVTTGVLAAVFGGLLRVRL